MRIVVRMTSGVDGYLRTERCFAGCERINRKVLVSECVSVWTQQGQNAVSVVRRTQCLSVPVRQVCGYGPYLSRILKNTVEYFDIIGALCVDNGKGEYPGLLLDTHCTVLCIPGDVTQKRVYSNSFEYRRYYEVSAELRVNGEVAATLKCLGKGKGMAQKGTFQKEFSVICGYR